MRDLSVPSSTGRSQWLTTADVARMLDVTSRWVRELATIGRLAYEPTRSGQRLFRQGDVLSLLEKRAKGRLRTRQELLAAVRPQMLRAGIEPRQARFRLVRSGGR